MDGYIKDALEENDQECARAFQDIEADEERHAKMLRTLASRFLKTETESAESSVANA